MKTALLMTAMAAALIVTQVAAQERDPGGAPHGPLTDFAELDVNGDGGITLEEVTAAATARFAQADTNGDGALSEAELIARAEEEALARIADQVARMVERRDVNGDGLLQPDEMMGRGPSPERLFDRFDADGDGIVTEAEFEVMKTRMQERRAGHEGRGQHGDNRGEHRGPRDNG